MMSGHDVPMLADRVAVISGVNRRRRWSPEAKAQLVAETYATSVNEVAERYNVARNQLFAWRRLAKLSGSSSGPCFVPVEVIDPASRTSPSGGGVIEVQIGAAGMRIPPGSDPAMVSTILMALKGVR